AAEFGMAGIFRVEVEWVLVHGQQGEPGVVGLADGAPGPVLVDVTHREVLVGASEALAVAPLAHLLCRSDHAPFSNVIPPRGYTSRCRPAPGKLHGCPPLPA